MVLFSLPSKNYHQNYNRGTTCLMFNFLKNKNILFWKTKYTYFSDVT